MRTSVLKLAHDRALIEEAYGLVPAPQTPARRATPAQSPLRVVLFAALPPGDGADDFQIG